MCWRKVLPTALLIVCLVLMTGSYAASAGQSALLGKQDVPNMATAVTDENSRPVLLASGRHTTWHRHGYHKHGPPYGRAWGYHSHRAKHHHFKHRQDDPYWYRHQRAYYGPRYQHYRSGRGSGWNLSSCISDRQGYVCFGLRN